MMMSVCSQDAKLAYDSCRRRFCPLQHSEGVRESPQFDVGELQISHDLQLVDAAEVLHAVSELEQVGSVHRQLELMGLTQDEDLRGGGGTETLRSRRASATRIGAYLKVLPRGEGEEGQLPLLLTPGPAQVRVPDEHARLDAGVQVEGDVLRPAAAQVHCKTEQNSSEVVGRLLIGAVKVGFTCEGTC